MHAHVKEREKPIVVVCAYLCSLCIYFFCVVVSSAPLCFVGFENSNNRHFHSTSVNDCRYDLYEMYE